MNKMTFFNVIIASVMFSCSLAFSGDEQVLIYKHDLAASSDTVCGVEKQDIADAVFPTVFQRTKKQGFDVDQFKLNERFFVEYIPALGVVQAGGCDPLCVTLDVSGLSPSDYYKMRVAAEYFNVQNMIDHLDE